MKIEKEYQTYKENYVENIYFDAGQRQLSMTVFINNIGLKNNFFRQQSLQPSRDGSNLLGHGNFR